MTDVGIPLAVWGPAGTIITGLTIAVVRLYTALQTERDNRIQDLKDFQTQATQLAQQSANKEEILYSKIEAARNGGR